VLSRTINQRSKVKIISSILKITMPGENKNQIRFRAFLTSRQLRAYLELMLKHNLVMFDETKRSYKTTADGIKFLEFEKLFGKMFDIMEYY